MMAHIDHTKESARAEEHNRKVRLHKFLSRAEEKNLNLITPVPYDGDCLFSSVISCTKQIGTSNDLRRRLVQFYATNRCPAELKSSIDGTF